jgi:hypothetical protein
MSHRQFESWVSMSKVRIRLLGAAVTTVGGAAGVGAGLTEFSIDDIADVGVTVPAQTLLGEVRAG